MELKTKSRQFQARPLKQKPEEEKAPMPETFVKFESDTTHLESEIAGVEITEEEVPVIPQYDLMKCEIAAGSQGEALRDLFNPYGVAIDENTGSIYVAEGYGFNKGCSIRLCLYNPNSNDKIGIYSTYISKFRHVLG